MESYKYPLLSALVNMAGRNFRMHLGMKNKVSALTFSRLYFRHFFWSGKEAAPPLWKNTCPCFVLGLCWNLLTWPWLFKKDSKGIASLVRVNIGQLSMTSTWVTLKMAAHRSTSFLQGEEECFPSQPPQLITLTQQRQNVGRDAQCKFFCTCTPTSDTSTQLWGLPNALCHLLPPVFVRQN